MNSTASTLLPTLIPLAVIGWMLLRRYQRLVTPQPLDARGRRRLLIRPLILGLVAVALLLVPHPAAGYLAALFGAVAGMALAFWSAGHTRYEFGSDGQASRYLPNAWIGGGVFALFVMRLLWRLWPLLSGQVSEGMAAQSQSAPDLSHFVGSSPLTTGLFLLFVAYQMGYSLLVLRAASSEAASKMGNQHE